MFPSKKGSVFEVQERSALEEAVEQSCVKWPLHRVCNEAGDDDPETLTPVPQAWQLGHCTAPAPLTLGESQPTVPNSVFTLCSPMSCLLLRCRAAVPITASPVAVPITGSPE